MWIYSEAECQYMHDCCVVQSEITLSGQKSKSKKKSFIKHHAAYTATIEHPASLSACLILFY